MKQNNIDLGTLVSAEMYYNKSGSCSYSCSDSTLQQSTDLAGPTNESVIAPKAQFPSSPSATSVRENQEKPRKNVPRKVSLDDHYTQIRMSVNDIRKGKRTDRMTAYLSLKDENDKKFSIFLRSSLTTATDETYRSLRKTDNRPLIEALNEMESNCPKNSNFYSGRIRYNPRKWKIEDEHKTNLKSAILCVYDHKTHMTAILFLLNEYYVIELNDDLTTKQQGTFDFTGLYQVDIGEEE